MAEPCVPCTFIPYTNICSCPPQRGVSVLQPACQVLTDGTVVNNPCYNIITGISTWTYKFFTDCTPGADVNPINYILIPICSGIPQNIIVVEERIESYGRFTLVPFTLNMDDRNFGQAPSGFQWLRIENNGRYERGVHVEYRINIAGNFPERAEPIMVRAGQSNLSFCCQGCYKVPGCPVPDRIEVEKNCQVVIRNNTAVLQYNVSINNTGGAALSQVQYQDILNYDGANVVLDSIVFPPDIPLQITSATPNTVIISGTIQRIAVGQSVRFSYNVPIVSFAQPGTFIFTNIATAASGSVSGSDTCTATVEVVRLEGGNTFAVSNGNHITSFITVLNTGASPKTNAGITVQIRIPQGVVIHFTDVSGSTAVFENGGAVALNTNITDAVINITHGSLPIPMAGGVRLSINMVVMSTSAFHSPAAITSTLQQISGADANQIYLLPVNVPAVASVNIMGGCNIE